jgi:lysophospholipase L1-like esterase
VALWLLVLATALSATSCNPEYPPAEGTKCRVGIVGDSLTLGTAPYFKADLARFGCSLVFLDAKDGRDTISGAQALAKADLTSVDVVVAALGTNDWYKPTRFRDAMEQVMRVAKGKRVVWLDVGGWLENKFAINDHLWDGTVDHDNMWVMSWSGVIAAHLDYLIGDGIHLTPAGYKARAWSLAKFIKDGKQPA